MTAGNSSDKRLVQAKLIAAPPAYVVTEKLEVNAYLRGLSTPDFDTTADVKTLWAVGAGAAEGAGSGSAYIVSAEVYRRLKAYRF